MKPETCEKCGGELEYRQEGSVQGLFCKNCDWAVVTTAIPAVLQDDTPYEVRLAGGDPRNESHIKAVAQVSGVNFLSARTLLQQPDPLVFKGEAAKVVEIRRALQGAGLKYDIRPPFPY